jgi:hypothetical protein
VSNFILQCIHGSAPPTCGSNDYVRFNVMGLLYPGPEERQLNNPRQGLYLDCALSQPAVQDALRLFVFPMTRKLFLDTESETESTHRNSHHGSNSFVTAVRPRLADCCTNSDCMFPYSRFLIRHGVLTSSPSQFLLILTSVVIYGCYFHPLAHIPGPFLAKFSPVCPSNPD